MRVALVTGGASGIGRTTVGRLAENGYQVVLGDLDPDTVAEAERSLQAHGEVHGLTLDVTSQASVDDAIRNIEARWAQLDVVVNNAGITRQGPLSSQTAADWTSMIDVHLGGAFLVCRAAYRLLRMSTAPAIVNVSSIASQLGLANRASYCAAKAGINGLTRGLAVEWAKDGIRVNAVAPGWTQTPLVDRAIRDGVVNLQELCSVIPLNRLGEPSEIADVIEFLLSGKATYITGQTIFVDGGVTAGSPA